MNMLINELEQLGSNPMSWVVVGVLALFAVHSVVGLYRCPHVHGKATYSEAEIATARAHRFHAGPRFAVMMILGIGLMLAGLFMIPYGIRPGIALALLVTGIVLTQTEPLRLILREHTYAIAAAQDGPEEALIGARDRLKSNHRSLAFTNIGMLVAVTAGLLAF